jgi:nitrate/nitrite transporter NarK
MALSLGGFVATHALAWMKDLTGNAASGFITAIVLLAISIVIASVAGQAVPDETANGLTGIRASGVSCSSTEPSRCSGSRP